MGGLFFHNIMRGAFKSPQDAFEALKEYEKQKLIKKYEELGYCEWKYDGYTGTILEKRSFKMVEISQNMNKYQIKKFIYNSPKSKFWNEKWNHDAGCIEIKGDALNKYRGKKWKGRSDFHVYHFFGMASD
jgi:hypothetical protein